MLSSASSKSPVLPPAPAITTVLFTLTVATRDPYGTKRGPGILVGAATSAITTGGFETGSMIVPHVGVSGTVTGHGPSYKTLHGKISRSMTSVHTSETLHKTTPLTHASGTVDVSIGVTDCPIIPSCRTRIFPLLAPGPDLDLGKVTPIILGTATSGTAPTPNVHRHVHSNTETGGNASKCPKGGTRGQNSRDTSCRRWLLRWHTKSKNPHTDAPIVRRIRYTLIGKRLRPTMVCSTYVGRHAIFTWKKTVGPTLLTRKTRDPVSFET